MGAFFLYRQNALLDLKAVKEVFCHKGFAAPNSFGLGDWRLLQYKKILLDNVENFIFEDRQAVFCCGTVIYYGLSYRDSLKRLLKDFQNNSVNQSELIGHFCLLYWNGSRLTVLTDQMNTFHFFVNDETTCFSSSFLAALSASPKPLPLNRLAICEKLATGYIISPDTLVKGISQLNDELAAGFSQDRHSISFVPHPPRPEIKLHNKGIDSSINKQIEVLKDHFGRLDNINSEFSGELGTSDGYDSRIVLACSKWLSKSLSLHTHASSMVKCLDASKTIVEQIASQTGNRLHIVPTKHILYTEPEQIIKTLDDSLYLFDARSSNNMGAFGEIYTQEYRKKILSGGQRFTLNGMGGEVYRNYYEIPRHWPINLRPWMNYFDYFCFAQEAVGDTVLFEEMHRSRLKKISARLNLDDVSFVDFLWLRRYYSEIKMPDGDSNNSDAQNQLSFYHMPFMQPNITYEGINANKYIGLAGSYEMALLRKISPALAVFPTHYGYCPDKRIPLKYTLIHHIKELCPPQLLRIRKRRGTYSRNREIINQTKLVMGKCSVLMESKECLLDSGSIKVFEKSIWDNCQQRNTFFVGTFLREFHNKLKW